MGTMEFEWEEIVVNIPRKGGRTKDNRVWLTAKHTKKDDDRLNMIFISANLCEKANWKQGIRVNLARQGNSLFRFKPSSTGLYTPRQINKSSKTMCLSGEVLVAELRPHINGTEFDAWVDGDTIYFKPVEK